MTIRAAAAGAGKGAVFHRFGNCTQPGTDLTGQTLDVERVLDLL